VENPVGGSDWIYGRLRGPALTGSTAENVGRAAGAFFSPPVVMQAAPGTARALAGMLREKAPGMVDDYVRAIGGRFDAVPNKMRFIRNKSFDSSVDVKDGGEVVVRLPNYFQHSADIRDKVFSAIRNAFKPNLPENTYWRFTNNKDEYELAKLGKLKNSRNHADNVEEAGLSVDDGLHYGVQGYKYAYQISGPKVGIGSDGEPLIDAATARPASKFMTAQDAMKEDKKLLLQALKKRGWTLEQYQQATNPEIPKHSDIPFE
jgi:hypothetical protein